jgi:hypothetical protein
MRILSLFQTVSGEWHWPSLLTVFGWVVGSLITGVFIFANLYVGRLDREKSGPWQLSQQQEITLLELFKKAPKGRLAVEYSAADQLRAHKFAEKLKEIFVASGYDVWGYMPSFVETGGPALVGLRVDVKKSNETSDNVGGHIQRAFIAIDFDAPGRNITSNNYEDDFVVVRVGIKP